MKSHRTLMYRKRQDAERKEREKGGLFILINLYLIVIQRLEEEKKKKKRRKKRTKEI